MRFIRTMFGPKTLVLCCVLALVNCGGGGGGTNTPTTPVQTNKDPSAIFQGTFASVSPMNGTVDITNGIILPTGETRLLLRNGKQIVGNIQITGSSFVSSALLVSSTTQETITLSNGKINSTAVNGGQANLTGNYTTATDSGTFTIYSTQALLDNWGSKSLINIAKIWGAVANSEVSSVYSLGTINANVDSTGFISLLIIDNNGYTIGTASGQFTQIASNYNEFKITITSNGQTYTGLAYTLESQTDSDKFLVILASNSIGVFYATMFHG